MQRYNCFNLEIDSVIPLPRLITGDRSKPRDLLIEYLDKDRLTPAQEANSTKELFLQIPDVADFIIRDGQSVLVKPLENTKIETLQIFLLGSVLGAVLQQRGMLTIHANAILGKNGVVAFAADSGCGKSTLSALALQNGLRILSDDLLAINFSKNQSEAAKCLPGYPWIKLWQKSLDLLNLKQTNLPLMHPDSDKYYYPLKNQFCTTPKPLHAIYILNLDASFPLQKLSGAAALLALNKQIYRQHFYSEMHLLPQLFQQLSLLSQKIAVYEIARPTLSGFADWWAKLPSECGQFFETSKISSAG